MADGYDKLTPELRKKLEEVSKRKPANRQVQILEDMANMNQELINLLDDGNKDSKSFRGDLAPVLLDMRASLETLRGKEAPKPKDHAKPVVDRLDKLEKAIVKALPKDKPQEVKVNAPKVDISPPDVDLKGVEKLLKTHIPKAFEKAISKIPEVQVPAVDFSEVIEVLHEMSIKLSEIDTATRMKPIAPSRVQVTNPDGSNIVDAGKLVTEKYDYVDVQQTSATVETYVYKEGGAGGTTVATVTMTYTDATKDEIDTMVKV